MLLLHEAVEEMPKIIQQAHADIKSKYLLEKKKNKLWAFEGIQPNFTIFL